MNGCLKRLKSRRSRLRRLGPNICGVALSAARGGGGTRGRLTCSRWCRRRCFPPHTAPVLGKHAGPVEQSAPGHRKQFYSWRGGKNSRRGDGKRPRRPLGSTCVWTGTCWAEPVGWTGTLVWRGTVEVESAPASGVCMAPEDDREQDPEVSTCWSDWCRNWWHHLTVKKDTGDTLKWTAE